MRSPAGPALSPAVLAGLAGAGLLARLPGLGRSLWYDEVFTLLHFAAPGAAFREQVAANNHPLASLLAWVARNLGSSEVALRAPFLLLGAAAVPALAWATAHLAGRRAGLLAGALAVLAPLHVAYAQQVRGYAGLLLAVSLLLGLTAAGLRRPPRRPAQAGLVLAASLGLLSHATLLLPLVGLGLLLGLAPRLGLASAAAARRLLFALAGGGALGALGYAPQGARLLKFVRRALTEGDPGAPGRLDLASVVELLGGGGPAGPGLAALLALLAAAGLLGLLRDPARRVHGLILLAPLASAAVLLALRAPAYPRFLLVALPAVLALAGRGAAALPGRWPLLPLGLALVLAGAGVSRQAGAELQDLRGAARLARGLVGAEGTLLAGGPAGEVLAAYVPGVLVDPGPAALRAHLEGGAAAACIEVFPAWTPPARRALLLERCGPPLVLPGRVAPVAIYLRP